MISRYGVYSFSNFGQNHGDEFSEVVQGSIYHLFHRVVGGVSLFQFVFNSAQYGVHIFGEIGHFALVPVCSKRTVELLFVNKVVWKFLAYKIPKILFGLQKRNPVLSHALFVRVLVYYRNPLDEKIFYIGYFLFIVRVLRSNVQFMENLVFPCVKQILIFSGLFAGFEF